MKKRLLFSSLTALVLLCLPLIPTPARQRVMDAPPNQVEIPKFPILRPVGPDLAKLAETSTDTKTMSAAIKAAGLEDSLKASGPYTLFAPSDAAFAKLPKEKVEALFRDPVKLREFVMKHVVRGDVNNRELALCASVVDVSGTSHAVVVKGTKQLVGDAKVVRSDVEASNGALYVIDSVLVPV